MKISSIAAVGKNFEIGIGPDLPWHLPDDFKYFKQTTLNHAVLMGRVSFDSIGRALPKRTNIVVTRNQYWYRSDVEIVHALEDGILKAQQIGEEELFIIGGGKIYEQSLPLIDKIYLTEVNVEIPQADVFFPKFDRDKWKVVYEEYHPKDEQHKYDFTFKQYQRIV